MPTPSLPVLDSTAAAIDVGSEQLHVSIAGGPPKVFGTTTGELHALRDYLLAQGVRSVAMEATGIYWLCPYEVLEKAGLAVVVVNGKYVKNLPGRKTDMSDCQWQATLHAHGLLKPGFVPPEHIRRLQDYLRLRTDHIVMAGSHEQAGQFISRILFTAARREYRKLRGLLSEPDTVPVRLARGAYNPATIDSFCLAGDES